MRSPAAAALAAALLLSAPRPAAAAPDSPPVVLAGPDAELTLPAVLPLAGEVADAETATELLHVQWEQLGGQGRVRFLDRSSAKTTATFSEPGVYRLRLTAHDGALRASDELEVTVHPLAGHLVRVRRLERRQTIRGWETTDGVASASAAFEAFAPELYERAADELGITRVRLEVRAGAESDRDWWALHDAGAIDQATWRSHRYATVDDGGGPGELRRDGFHFSELDAHVRRAVLPMRRELEESGRRLHVNLCYVAFTDQNAPGLAYGHDDPEEYAEFLTAASLHLRERFGIDPDTWEVCLEPDNVAEWDGSLLGRAIVAAGRHLEEAGFAPRFVAPSVTNMGAFAAYFDAMVAVPGAVELLAEASYHRYGGTTESNLQLIRERARSYGLETSQLEYIGATHHDLHEDLKVGGVSSWAQYTLASGWSGVDNGAQYYLVEDTDPTAPRVVPGWRTRYLRHYFAYLPPGSVRVDAGSTHFGIDPLAFTRPDGGDVLVVKANAARDFHVWGLRRGTYRIEYTTPFEQGVELPPVTILPGQMLPVSIPARGVVTVYDAGRP